jgi:DNA-binding XRE family transcriptional regulator
VEPQQSFHLIGLIRTLPQLFTACNNVDYIPWTGSLIFSIIRTMITESFHHLQQILAFNIKEKRKALGVTQEQLALDAEIDRTYVSQIERGIGNPSLLILVKIAYRLETNVLALLAPNLVQIAENGQDES